MNVKNKIEYKLFFFSEGIETYQWNESKNMEYKLYFSQGIKTYPWNKSTKWICANF